MPRFLIQIQMLFEARFWSPQRNHSLELAERRERKRAPFGKSRSRLSEPIQAIHHLIPGEILLCHWSCEVNKMRLGDHTHIKCLIPYNMQFLLVFVAFHWSPMKASVAPKDNRGLESGGGGHERHGSKLLGCLFKASNHSTKALTKRPLQIQSTKRKRLS